MKNRALRAPLALILCVCGAVKAGAIAPVLFVSPAGSDQAAGTPAQPVATLARAVEMSRTLHPAGQPAKIYAQAGTYRLAATLALGPQDAGLRIEGERAAPVVISGGRRVTGWKPWKGQILQADLTLSDLTFKELYYNGKLMTWARTPNVDPKAPRTSGFIFNERVAEPDTKNKLVYRAGDLHPERWAHPERAWMLWHDRLNYCTPFYPVTSIDRETRTLTAVRGADTVSVGDPFFLCGILEELDAPGEWCVDPDARVLYFLPPAGDPNGADEVVVPVLSSLLTIEGAPAQDAWAEKIHIEGLDWRDCRGPALRLAGAREVVIARCDLRNAETGIVVNDPSRGIRIAGCDITGTMNSGLAIVNATEEMERLTDITVDNCYIWDLGKGATFHACAGIEVKHAVRVSLTHNRIHDTPRMGICLQNTRACEAAWNVIHHGAQQTMDAALIWGDTTYDTPKPSAEQLRLAPRYTDNAIHHNLLYDSGGWGNYGNYGHTLAGPKYTFGIYFDHHGSGWRVHDNIIIDTAWGAYQVHGGDNNVFENNICVNSKVYLTHLMGDPLAPWWKTTGNMVSRNVFAMNPAGTLSAVHCLEFLSREHYALDNNLIWAGGETPRVEAPFEEPQGNGKSAWTGWQSFETWQKAGSNDIGSIVADPQFVDPAKRDYRLKPTSPAFKLGIRPVDLTSAGLYASAERRIWPRPEETVPREEMDYTPEFGKQRFRDYEDVPLGNSETEAPLRQNWTASEGNIEIVDTTAASGKRSLRFTDVAGLKHPFLPCVTYRLPLREGKATVSFDFRWEKDGMMEMDWRDDPSIVMSGPNIATTADGWLTANGKKLLQLPAGQWLHIDIVCPLGKDANGTFDVTVTLPKSEPQVFRGLACPSTFKQLECIVLSAAGDAPGVFYIDNLDFRP